MSDFPPVSAKPMVGTSGALRLDKAVLWAKGQSYFSALLIPAITFTLLFVFMYSVPLVIEKRAGAPIFPNQQWMNFSILLVHIATAIPPLVLGVIAFSKQLRNRSLRLHRWIGTTYCVCIWISAVTGVMLASANRKGTAAVLGFGLLGVSWFITTYLAYTTARAKDIVSHRRWMIRSYALTLAVVSIRPMFLFGPPGIIPVETWYLMVTWICWVPNLILAEFYIRTTKPNGKLRWV